MGILQRFGRKAKDDGPPDAAPEEAAEPTPEELAAAAKRAEADVLAGEADPALPPDGAPEEGDIPPEVAALTTFCNTQCADRNTCPLRLGFIHFAKGHETILEAYPPTDHPEVDAALQTVEPVIEMLEITRLRCAQTRADEHEAERRAEAERRERVKQLRPVLEELVAEILRDRVPPAPPQPAAAPPQPAAAPPHPAPVEAATRSVVPTPPGAVVRQEAVTDARAQELVREYREKFPHDDAEAYRELRKLTPVTLSQYCRITGKSKGVVSEWAKGARATTSLNRERAEAVAASAPARAEEATG